MFSIGVSQEVTVIRLVGGRLHGFVSSPRPLRQHENQACQLDEGRFNVNTDAEVENMWKPTYMESLPL